MPLIVTHTEGYLACFTKEADGSMRQRALIDTGEQAPTPIVLAELGTKLAAEYGWSFDQPVIKAPAKALPAKKAKAIPAKANGRHVPRPKGPMTVDPETGRASISADPPIAKRLELIKGYLADHPDQTMTEVIEGVGLESDHARKARWHHQFALLLKMQQIVWVNTGIRPMIFRLADPQPELPIDG